MTKASRATSAMSAVTMLAMAIESDMVLLSVSSFQ